MYLLPILQLNWTEQGLQMLPLSVNSPSDFTTELNWTEQGLQMLQLSVNFPSDFTIELNWTEQGLQMLHLSVTTHLHFKHLREAAGLPDAQVPNILSLID